MKTPKYFTLYELLQSHTAVVRKIENIPTFEQVENLNRLAVEILDPVRLHYGMPVVVTSGFRSDELNKAVKGSKGSQHKEGEAADITTKENTKARNKLLFELMVAMVKQGIITVGQLINEKNYSWIHVSLPNAKHKNEILNL